MDDARTVLNKYVQKNKLPKVEFRFQELEVGENGNPFWQAEGFIEGVTPWCPGEPEPNKHKARQSASRAVGKALGIEMPPPVPKRFQKLVSFQNQFDGLPDGAFFAVSQEHGISMEDWAAFGAWHERAERKTKGLTATA